MGLTPCHALLYVIEKQCMNYALCRCLDKVQCYLNLIELMQLYFLLEYLDLSYPCRRKGGRLRIEMRPAVGSVCGRETAKERENPVGCAAVAATNPVAFRVCRTRCLGLYEGRGLKA